MSRTLTVSSFVTLNWVIAADGSWLGINQIIIAGEQLLAPGRRLMCEIRTPDGVILCNYAPIGEEHAADGSTTLRFSVRSRTDRLSEWQLHAPRQRLSLDEIGAESIAQPGTYVELVLRPAARSLGTTRAIGFSYQWRFHSDRLAIYRLLECAAWAPGGTVSGSELRQRNCFVDSQPTLGDASTHWSSEWHLPTCESPDIFQLVPLQTELQGFTFLSGARGTLLTWATRLAHVRTLIEKPRGLDAVRHWHEHCSDLAKEQETAPIEVLWLPGAQDAAACDDLHERMRELVYGVLHTELGLRPERVLSHGMMEEWTNPDLERYRSRGLPLLLQAGIREIFVPSWIHQQQNQWNISNMCVTIDQRIAPRLDPATVKAIIAEAKAGGSRIQMWWNTYISVIAQVLWERNHAGSWDVAVPPSGPGTLGGALRSARHGLIRSQGGHRDHDHYDEVYCLNLRDPVINAHLLEAWGRLHDELGLDSLFNDSSFNCASDKFHWSRNPDADPNTPTSDQVKLLGQQRGEHEPQSRILSQWRAHLDLWVGLQRRGLRIGGEDLGVFGVHRHGPGTGMRVKSMALWSDCQGTFDADLIRPTGADPDAVFFAGFACRCPWSISWDIATDRLSLNHAASSTHSGIRGAHDEVRPFHFDIIKAFNVAEPFMHQRTTLPEGKGYLYRQGSTRILWATEAADHDLGGTAQITDLITGATESATRLRAGRQRVYRID